MEEDCVFCKIVEGKIPSEKVYEDDTVIAFKDINPAAPVHILVIPKKHIISLLEVNEFEEENKNLISHIYQVINNIAKDMKIEKDGFRVIVNCGKDAGQEVMHLHFHLLAGRKLGAKIVGECEC